jgi:Ser-tRNA(Ala) deacylase AlaX
MEEKKEPDPRMHSAEHILNGTMVKMFNKGRSFSAHIEKKKSKCDYRNFEKNLTDEELNELEAKVNGVIKTEAPVYEEFLPRAEAEKLFNLERLPEGTGDTIRIIKVGAYDACPCSGKHVSNTREIGSFRIISSGFENGVLRIRYKLD